jgi:ABC-2 type transport system permease protein
LAKAARDQRRSVIGWGIAVAAVVLMYSSFYPSIEESAADLSSYIENLPEAIRNLIGAEDYSSAVGYLQAEFFSTMGPLLLLIFTIGAGSRAIAGEEEAGTLDLLLSTPVRRRRVLETKALAIVVSAALLGAVAAVVVGVVGPLFDLRVPFEDVVVACVMLTLLAVAFGAIAFAVGAATGHRAIANAAAGGLAVVALIVNALGPTVDWLRPLRPFSPFRWYLEPGPLMSGPRAANAAVLIGIAIAGYAIAFVTFDRRDLAV